MNMRIKGGIIVRVVMGLGPSLHVCVLLPLLFLLMQLQLLQLPLLSLNALARHQKRAQPRRSRSRRWRRLMLQRLLLTLHGACCRMQHGAGIARKAGGGGCKFIPSSGWRKGG